MTGTGSLDGSPPADRPRIDVGVLFADHGARVLAFAHRMLGDRAEAEDTTQETFLKAHRQASDFDGRCAPSTWLLAIARNTCLDQLRARRSRSFDSLEALVTQANQQQAGLGQSVQSAQSAQSAPDAASEAHRGWYVEAVREGCLLATLSCLTADQRAAFVLRVLCDLSARDTAIVLDRSENAVRVLTSRARARLKDFLCRNCSLYDPANPCRCQNLVGFSLAQGWITPQDRRIPRAQAAALASRTATAINAATRLADLYRSLDAPELGPDLVARFEAALRPLAATATTADPACADRPQT